MPGYYEMPQLLHDDNNVDAKGIVIPSVFSENSRAKNARNIFYKLYGMFPLFFTVKYYLY